MATIGVAMFASCSNDDGCPTKKWYQDADGDQLGNPNSFVEACTQPKGYVDNANDKDDTDFCEVKTWYKDMDGDGKGNPSEKKEACTQPKGYVADNTDEIDNTNVNFEFLSTISLKDGENKGVAEISAYCKISKRLFTTNPKNGNGVIEVINLADPSKPVKETPISVGSANSVAVHNGKLAVAVENENKQALGTIKIYDTTSLAEENSITVGSLPDMVTYTPDGKYILVANEGEPNDDYTIDPKGTISRIDVATGTVKEAGFESFNSLEKNLESLGLRIFGPNATLAMDIEPEYIAVSDDSKTAWITLQENNGIAKLDIASATITDIYPLGFKDYNATMNSFDASNKDGRTELKNWPVLGMYQPDALSYFNVNGVGYLITANEGDARDYDGYSEEKRLKKLTLDPTLFPNAEELLKDENLGRLKTTTANGDIDGDGDVDVIYSYGARSFSIWSESGSLVYDSMNEIARKNLEIAPDTFNIDSEEDGVPTIRNGEVDGRSDDKGAEPEATAVLNMKGKRQLAFVGLERVSAVMVYDVTNPNAPKFLQWLQRNEDVSPEGLVTIFREDSPNGKDLLIVSNEVSGTVSIFQNNQ